MYNFTTSIKKTLKIEAFRDAINNTFYRCKVYQDKFQNTISQKTNCPQGCHIYLLGEKIKNQEELKEKIENILWFTYRKISDLPKNIASDRGWGCLIRVGQMVLSNCICQFAVKKRMDISKKTITKEFLDDGKFSLTNFVSLNKGKQCGDWFQNGQVCETIRKIYRQNPIQGTENLTFIHFDNGIIFLDQVYSKFNLKPCKCEHKNVVCPNCHGEVRSEKYSIQVFQSKLGSSSPPQSISRQKNVILMVTVRLGDKQIDKVHYQMILQLASLGCSMGIIGGSGGRGLYFVGTNKEKLICLDPHYVQDEVTMTNFSVHREQFHTKDYLSYGRKRIAVSMSLIFYLENLNDLAQIQETIEKCDSEKFLNVFEEDQFRDISEIETEHEEPYKKGRISFIK